MRALTPGDRLLLLDPPFTPALSEGSLEPSVGAARLVDIDVDMASKNCWSFRTDRTKGGMKVRGWEYPLARILRQRIRIGTWPPIEGGALTYNEYLTS